uniref:RNA-directed RNA polymerase n=1 Tax=Rhizoctonia cerealis phyllomonavirus TaxID=3068671 RepID=A0AA51BSE6_9MONO|nr:MAG: RNA-dependent RNA polymerase [Rhizoctonia cerealis phyllomonavirus]
MDNTEFEEQYYPPEREMPYNLDSILSDIEMDTIMKVLHPDQPFPRLKSRPALRGAEVFVEQLRGIPSVAGLIATASRWTVYTTVAVIEAIIDDDPPRRSASIPNPEPVNLTLRTILSGLRSRGVILEDIEVSFSDQLKRIMKSVQRVRDCYDRTRRLRQPTQVRIGRWKVITCPGGVALESPTGLIVAPLSFFLAVLDACENIRNTSMCVETVNNPNGTSELTTGLVVAVARWQWSVIREYGVGGYSVAKAPEALAKTHISRLSGGDVAGIQPCHQNMVEKYAEKERGLGQSGQPLIHELERILLALTDHKAAIGIFGSFHFTGYPILDPIRCGATSLQSARRPDDSEPEAIMTTRNLLMHLVVKNFIAAQGRFPPLAFSERQTQLKTMYTHSLLNYHDGSVPLSDYDDVEFKKFLEFDYQDGYTDYLIDKACFEGRDLRQARYDGRPIPLHKTRLLEHFLQREGFDSRKLMEMYATRTFPADVRGARKVAKEKEYKVDSMGGGARLFVTQHPDFRWCAGVLNNNLKKTFFQYFPYTSMAMSQAQVLEFLQSATAPQTRLKKVLIDVDYSNWNARFLSAWMRIGGAVLNKAYGTPGFWGAIHDHFQEFEFGVAGFNMRVDSLENTSLRDRQESNFTTYYNDPTGNEGIAQREWTIWTCTMFYWALMGTRHSFTILGQGDNQVVVLTLVGVDDDALGAEVMDIMRRVEDYSARLNQTSKPEEFTYSTSMGMYGKVVYVNGYHEPCETKFAARISPACDELAPTFEDSCGAIMSGALATARSSESPLRCYALGLYHLLSFLSRAARSATNFAEALSPYCRELVRDPIAFCTAAFMTSQVGGLPIPSWSSFLWGNDADPLTQVISELRCTQTFCGSRGIAAHLLDDSSYTEVDPLSLLDNPYGLPLRLPSMATAVYRDAVVSHVASARNRDISELVALSEQSKEPLAREVLLTQPCFPLIAADLVSISAVGRGAKVVAKFKAAGSLTGAVVTGRLQDEFRDRAQERAQRVLSLIASIIRRSRVPALPSQFGQRSDVVAVSLRNRWGLGTLHGMNAVAPLDYQIHYNLGPGVVAVIAPGRQRGVRGPWKAYMGSKTREKRLEPEFDIEEAPGLDDLRKLVLSATTGALSPELRRSYEMIAATRTDTPFEQLLRLFPTIEGGTPAHRYEPLSGGGRIAPIGTLGEFTWIKLNTDNVPGISGGLIDYQVPMQTFMSWVARVATWAPASAGRVVRISLSNEGLVPLQDIVRTARGELESVPRLRGNPLCMTPDLRVLSFSAAIPGQVIQSDQALQRPISVLAGAIFSQVTLRGRFDLAADLGTRVDLPDVAAFCAMGGRRVFSAMVVACGLGTVWGMSTIVGREQHRHHIDVLAHNVASAICDAVFEHIEHPEFDSSWLCRNDLLVFGTGSAAATSGRRTLAQSVARWSVERILDPQRFNTLWGSVIFPRVIRQHPYLLSTRFKLVGLIWAWTLSSPHTLFGQAKRLLARICHRIRDHYSGELLIDDHDLPSAHIVNQSFRHIIPETPHVLAAMDLADRDLVVLEGGVSSALRLLRQARRPTRSTVTPVNPDLPSGGDVGTFTAEQSGSSLTFPYTLGPQLPGRTPSQVARDKFGRTYGRKSVAGHAWGPLLAQLSGPVLVVGTGAGGIQSYLAQLGVETLGFDLASTLPELQATSVRPLVPESEPGWECYYSSRVVEGSGDWFSEGAIVLRDNQWETVIIDIQSSSERHWLELLEPLITAAWRGTALVTMYLSRDEVDMTYSRLRASSGVHVQQVISVSQFSNELVVPIIFRLRVVGDIVLSDSGSLFHVTITRRMTPGEETRSLARRWQQLTSIASAGAVCATSAQDAIEQCTTLIDRAGASRASTSGGSLLHVARLYTVLAHLTLQRTDPFTAFDTRPRGWSNGHLYISGNDTTVEYILHKFGPRILTLIAQ